MSAGPYSIGADVWPGLAKLIEECGEVMQVAGKLIALGDSKPQEFYLHWDGTDVRKRLESELGDLLGAIQFIIHQNGLDEELILGGAELKFNRFISWQQSQSALSEQAQIQRRIAQNIAAGEAEIAAGGGVTLDEVMLGRHGATLEVENDELRTKWLNARGIGATRDL